MSQPTSQTGLDALAAYVVTAAGRNKRRLKEAQAAGHLGPLVAEALYLMSSDVHPPGDTVSQHYARAGTGLDPEVADTLLAEAGGDIAEAAKRGKVSRASIYRACGLQQKGDSDAEVYPAAAAAD